MSCDRPRPAHRPRRPRSCGLLRRLRGGQRRPHRRQRDGRTLWSLAIGSHVARRDGTAEYEPLPSERDDDFIVRTRFSADEACDVALRIIGVDPAKVAQVRAVLRALSASNGGPR